jgi:hypothetical protein
MTDASTAEPTGAISRTYIGPDLTKVGKAKTLGSPEELCGCPQTKTYWQDCLSPKDSKRRSQV